MLACQAARDALFEGPEANPTERLHQRGRLVELARLFLKLGAISFGGPAAQIALMRDEVVERRRWLTEQEFLDLLGATNLIPGPNSTEMAIHIGHRRAGMAGLLVAGSCFILPAVAIVSTLVDPVGVALAASSALLLFTTRLNSIWLIAAGAAVGLVRAF